MLSSLLKNVVYEINHQLTAFIIKCSLFVWLLYRCVTLTALRRLRAGGQRLGVRDPAAEKPAPRAHRSVLRLSEGPQ